MDRSYALLLSRQHRDVAPSTFWFRATVEAARRFAGRILVGGEGLVPLDVSAWAQRRAGGRVETVPRRGRGKTSWASLDEEVAKRADELVAVAVRRGGIMERLGLEALSSGKTVHAVVPPPGVDELEGNSALLAAGATALELSLPPLVEIPAILPFVPRDPLASTPSYLWHFTRSSPGPWPGETREAWFESLAENRPGAAHSVVDALARILSERRIRACSRLIRGSLPVVCFTEEDPAVLAERRSFRPSLLRWDFEPVALGIRRDAALRLEIRPVRYLPAAEFESLSPGDRHLFQKHAPPGVDYTHEKEWRALGDVDLTAVPDADLALWTPPS